MGDPTELLTYYLDLSGAGLYGAALTGADLSGADLSGAMADGETRWPRGFDPARRGVRT